MSSNNLNTVSNRTDLNSSASKFFNNFYQPGFTTTSNIDSAVIGYFERIADNTQSARIMASAVIYTAMSQNINPMSIIEEFKTMSQEEMNSYVTLFLNLNRVGTSYLGIHNRPTTSKYVRRMIRP